MIASHFVLADILQTLESGNVSEAEKIFAKFERRYHADKKLQEAYKEFEDYLMDKDDAKLKDVGKKLKELRATRKFESSGGSALPLRDRRHFTSISCHEYKER
ncbi:MAG: hypothetical protein ABH834_03870 [Candidatus Altiarchaeota archaeon]